MKRFDLQLFGTSVVQGKKIIYLYRVQEDAATLDGAIMAFTTENERTKSKDADVTQTKDGPVRTPGTIEQEITATALLEKGSTLIPKLEAALDDDKLIELWEANLEESKGAIYAQTSDVTIDPSKTYYTRSGTSPNYTYTPVANPVVASINTYYEKTGEKFAGKYFQGYLTEISYSSNAEDMVEVSTTFGINGKGADGDVTVTAEQQDIANYVFKDTAKTGA